MIAFKAGLRMVGCCRRVRNGEHLVESVLERGRFTLVAALLLLLQHM